MSDALHDSAIVDQLIREADHWQIKMMLDYYRQTIGPLPPNVAEIAAQWGRV